MTVTMLSLVAASIFACSALAAPVQEGRFTFYPVPTPLSGICDLSEDPTRKFIWYEDILVNRVGRFNPATGEMRDFAIPFTTPVSNQSFPIPDALQQIVDRTAFSCAIRNGADGNMYAANGDRNQLVRIRDQASENPKIDVLGPVDPTGNLFPFNDLYTTEDGLYITQTTGNTFEFYSFKDETFTTYNVPTPLALPLGVFAASNGFIYIPELVGNKILEFQPKTKQITEYPLPLPLQGPAVARAEHDGKVYFSLFQGDGIGRIDITTKKIELFNSGQPGGLGGVTTGPSKEGSVFGTYFTVNAISVLNTQTTEYNFIAFPGTFQQFIPQGGVLGDAPPYIDVSAEYRDSENALYFGSILRNALGKYDLNGTGY
ncbi:Hypothetical predicted protein [Lecanosticta acicola]|uniref:Uncharacterized protein n=1 Tax=Lecanosticta acicola TaxID=111012 RepID=A0AAI8YVM8_9PEZI|nr:Hypothetical predicted protein [Lecanosticta acicola]